MIEELHYLCYLSVLQKPFHPTSSKNRDTALSCDQTRLTQLLLGSRGATNQEKVGLKGIKISK